MANKSIWSSVNTCVEIGFEILRFMAANGKAKGAGKGTEVETIADGILLMSNDKEALIAVSRDTASQSLSDTAVSYGEEKDGYLIYNGAMAAIPPFELSRINDGVREHRQRGKHTGHTVRKLPRIRKSPQHGIPAQSADRGRRRASVLVPAKTA